MSWPQQMSLRLFKIQQHLMLHLIFPRVFVPQSLGPLFLTIPPSLGQRGQLVQRSAGFLLQDFPAGLPPHHAVAAWLRCPVRHQGPGAHVFGAHGLDPETRLRIGERKRLQPGLQQGGDVVGMGWAKTG